jgi:long-chain acyl-CoA synthetase
MRTSTKPGNRSESDNVYVRPFHGIISGPRSASDGVAEHADRIAGGFALGVKQGDSVAMLMRNDIAFIEAAMPRCGRPYGVP